ncbi:MAG: hypothetical protein GYA16_12215 [Spirochaetes bacterium]|nr:hypothetical protein [Spirochaetota bacterium]
MLDYDDNIEKISDLVSDYLKDVCLYPIDGKKGFDEAYQNLKRMLSKDNFDIAQKILHDYFGV